jgi:hypothetical protein
LTVSAALVAASVTAGVPGPGSAAAGGRGSWLHPKARAWHVTNQQDVQALVVAATAVLQSLRVYPLGCSSTSIGGTSCGISNIDPRDWPGGLTNQKCSVLSAAVVKARSDPPIPSALAQRWWSSALDELTSACRVVDLAILASASSAGPDETSYEPTLGEFESGITLLGRLGQYASARVEGSPTGGRGR